MSVYLQNLRMSSLQIYPSPHFNCFTVRTGWSGGCHVIVNVERRRRRLSNRHHGPRTGTTAAPAALSSL